MGLEFRITGLDQAIKNIKTLQAKAQKSIARKAARQAMNIVRDAARQNARAIDDPETAARIFKNIITGESSAASRQAGGVVMRVGIKGGASSNQHSKDMSKTSGGDTRHWRYIEFGTSHIAAVPFMRPALANNVGRVMEKFTTEFRKGVNEAISR